MTPMYFDREGQPISMDRWSVLFEDLAYKHVAMTAIDTEVEVSTVWMGLNHQFGEGPPLTFETMIFGGEHNQQCWRWSTQEAALAGHDQIVTMLREGAVR